MLNVALTGSAASGKSTVACWFAEWGATVIDADAIAADVERPGTEAFAAIVRRFGNDVVRPDGSLDRGALRRMVLADAAALGALNAIVHPEVQRRRQALMEEAGRRGDTILVSDIPLLFEVLDPEDFDLVVLVASPVAVRRQRLVQRGLTDDEADRLIVSQLPEEAKRARSHIVIDNSGSLEALRSAASDAWQAICRRAAE